MVTRFLIFICIIFTGCIGSSLVTAPTKTFNGLYNEFLEEDETLISNNYLKMLSKKGEELFIIRQFYPDTRTLIQYQEFRDKKLTVPHGTFITWSDEGVKNYEVNFINGEEEGNSIRYDRWKGHKVSEGKYEKGEQFGKWIYFDSKGRLKEELVFKNGIREGEFVLYDTLGLIINKGRYEADTIFSQSLKDIEPLYGANEELVRSEKMPMFDACSDQPEAARGACSQRKMLEFIYKNIKYPGFARSNEIEGVAISQFTVEKDGSITNVRMIKGICNDIKNEVLRVINAMPKWIPGYQDGEAVRVLFTLPVRFSLN